MFFTIIQWAIPIIIILYLLAGCIMAWYESSQTDDQFKWKSVILWLPMMFGIKI
jgi:hypothetical protein